MSTPDTLHYALVIAPEGRELVRIRTDGTITYGPEYTPDEAAKCFWQAMAQFVPAMVRQQAEEIAALTRRISDVTSKHAADTQRWNELLAQQRAESECYAHDARCTHVELEIEKRLHTKASEQVGQFAEYAVTLTSALKELCRLKHTKRLAEALSPGSYRDQLLSEYEAGKEPAWAAASAALAKNPINGGIVQGEGSIQNGTATGSSAASAAPDLAPDQTPTPLEPSNEEKTKPCPACQGDGEIEFGYWNDPYPSRVEKCRACDGTGTEE